MHIICNDIFVEFCLVYVSEQLLYYFCSYTSDYQNKRSFQHKYSSFSVLTSVSSFSVLTSVVKIYICRSFAVVAIKIFIIVFHVFLYFNYVQLINLTAKRRDRKLESDKAIYFFPIFSLIYSKRLIECRNSYVSAQTKYWKILLCFGCIPCLCTISSASLKQRQVFILITNLCIHPEKI